MRLAGLAEPVVSLRAQSNSAWSEAYRYIDALVREHQRSQGTPDIVEAVVRRDSVVDQDAVGVADRASGLMGDLDERLGGVVLLNGPGNPRRVAEYALQVLVNASHGVALPPVPVAPDP